MAYVRSTALARRTGMNSYLSVYYGRRRIGLGDVSAAEAESIGNTVGAAVGIPGAGSAAAPIIQGLQSIFGGNPATGANAQRQAKVYSYYGMAMTDPGSAPSVGAVITLQAISTNGYDSYQHLQQNNPQATRTYATQALQALASQGWENVYGSNPMYTGIPQSGAIYAADQTTGQQGVVGVRPLATGHAALGGSTLLWLLLLGGGFLLVSGRSSSSSSSSVVHHNRYHRNRKRRRSRRGGR
jgi:hypothetical protein